MQAAHETNVADLEGSENIARSDNARGGISVQWLFRSYHVESDGTVLVWDDVADHYTTCHSLSAREQEAIRSEARHMSRRLYSETVSY